jgi:hypothetical protein
LKSFTTLRIWIFQKIPCFYMAFLEVCRGWFLFQSGTVLVKWYLKVKAVCVKTQNMCFILFYFILFFQNNELSTINEHSVLNWIPIEENLCMHWKKNYIQVSVMYNHLGLFAIEYRSYKLHEFILHVLSVWTLVIGYKHMLAINTCAANNLCSDCALCGS